MSFSDAEIKKFLCGQGFPETTTVLTTDNTVLTAEIVTAPNETLRSRAFHYETNREKVVFAILILVMGVGFILAATRQFDILAAVMMMPMVVIESILFAMGCLCAMTEYNIKHLFTQRVDDAIVLQTVSKRFRNRLLLQGTSYHVLVKYRVENQHYLKILHVTKAEHDWAQPGEVVAPLMCIPHKPKTAMAVRPRHAAKRRRVLVTSVLGTLLHFATLALWIASADREQNGGDSSAGESSDNDDDPWFFFYLTLGMMAFCVLLLAAKLRALLRLKLADYVTLHEATAVTTEDKPHSPTMVKHVAENNTKV